MGGGGRREGGWKGDGVARLEQKGRDHLSTIEERNCLSPPGAASLQTAAEAPGSSHYHSHQPDPRNLQKWSEHCKAERVGDAETESVQLLDQNLLFFSKHRATEGEETRDRDRETETEGERHR